MIFGTFSVPRLVEESKCRSCEKYQFTTIRKHKIHSTTLTPNIKFGAPLITNEPIDSSIFVNDDETCKLSFPTTVSCQNYLTTKFVGVLPLEDYSDGHFTSAGTEFTLVCRNGNPNDTYRVFGTLDGVHGYGTAQTVKTTTDGLAPALPTSESSRKFLRGDGQWVIPKRQDLDP